MKILYFVLLIAAFATQRKLSITGETGNIKFEDCEADSYRMYSSAAFKTFKDDTVTMTLEKVDENFEAQFNEQLKVDGNLLTDKTKPITVSNVPQWRMVVYEDFQGLVEHWSIEDVSNCGRGPNIMLGGHCKLAGDQIVSKTFNNLPEHSRVRVRFNINFIDEWQGETLTLKVNDKLVWTYGFKSCDRLLKDECINYGVNTCGDTFPDRLGHPVDLNLLHDKSSLSFSIESNIERDSCQISWGIDDLEIYVK